MAAQARRRSINTFIKRSVHRRDSLKTECSDDLLSDAIANLAEKLASARNSC